jgi:hypothetical protein
MRHEDVAHALPQLKDPRAVEALATAVHVTERLRCWDAELARKGPSGR